MLINRELVLRFLHIFIVFIQIYEAIIYDDLSIIELVGKKLLRILKHILTLENT